MSPMFRHDAGLYDGDEGLLSLLVPFAQDGAAAGEPLVFALHDRHADLLRPALAGTPGITFLPFAYACPAAAIRALLDLFEGQAAGAGGPMRIVGEVYEPTLATWEPWARYEAAVNRLYADFDVWALCAYDTRTTPDEVLDDVVCTHPRIATAGRSCLPSDSYQSPERFLAARPEPPADPLERMPPALELIDPGAATARRAVADLASQYGCLPHEQIDSLSFGLSEAVTNAHLHG
ncbi:MAG: MEDS domain-containing protein, partial [Solirubrobacteraceae bacterium]